MNHRKSTNSKTAKDKPGCAPSGLLGHVEYSLETPLKFKMSNKRRALRGLRLLKAVLAKKRLTEEQRRDIIAALQPVIC